MLEAVFKYDFLQNAVFTAIFASIVCGIIGVIIVQKKLIMMSGGIAHTAYGGVGLAYLLGYEPMFGAVIFSLIASMGLGYIKRKNKENSEVALGIFWSLGMAVGIISVSLSSGYPPDMNSYLFGNILSVTKSNVNIILMLTIITIFLIFAFYPYWKTYLFDDVFAQIKGMPVVFMEYLLLLLIAITVVILIKVAGIMLIIALLTVPAVTASLLSKKLNTRMLLASAFGMIYSLLGLYFSYILDIPSGATIIIVSVLGYIIVYMLTKICKLSKKTAL